MSYTTLNEFNQTGIEGLFRYTAEIVPIFFPLVLFAFFIVIMLGTSLLSTRRNFGESFAIAGFVTFIVSIVMSMISGILPTIAVAVCFVVSISI